MNLIPTRSGRWLAQAAAALALAAMLAATPAAGQSSEVQALRKRIDVLEGRITSMRNELRAKSRGGVRRISGELPPTLAGQFDVRLNELERALQKLTGKVEDLTHATNTANARSEKFRTDVEFRLSRLEKGAGLTTADKPRDRTNAGKLDKPPAKGAKPGSQPPQKASLPKEALPPGTPSQQYAHAKGLLRKGEFDRAADSLGAFIKAYPKGPLTGNAYYWLGETYYVRGRFREAAIQFAEGFQKFAKHPKAPDNLLKLGMSLARLNKRPEACASLIELRRRYPKAGRYVSRTAATERRRLGCR